MKRYNLLLVVIALFLGHENVSSQVTQQNATLNADVDFVDGDTYSDSGGPAGVYSASENSTLQLCSAPGGTITITFTEFNLEAGSGGQCWDHLQVTGDTGGNDGYWTGDTFDVSDTGSPFTPPCSDDATDAMDNLVIPSFTSDVGQCLGFTFTSDDSGQQDGWLATINVDSPPPVPTMGQWGIMILFILLSIYGIISIKQRKTSLS